MSRKLAAFGIASLLAVGVLFFSPAGDDSAFVAQVTPATADAGDCKPDEVLRAARLSRADLTRTQSADLPKWCTRMDRLDTAPASSTAPAPSGPGSISSGPDSTTIWCGKQVCACWKGKYYDGCHHLSMCTGPLTCYGKICVCKTEG